MPPDSGALLRAAEIALAQVAGRPDLDRSRLSSGSVGDLHNVASRLGSVGDVVTRVRRITTEELRSMAMAGVTVMAPLASGWLVAGNRGAVIVAPERERGIALSRGALRRALGDDAVDAIVIERRLGLESLSKHSTGTKKPWVRLRALMALEAPELAVLVVYAVVLGGLSLALPVAVQVLVNTIAFGSLLQPLIILAILLFAVLSFSGALQILQAYTAEVVHRRVFVRVAEDFARRLATVSRQHAREVDTRELTNRFFEVVTLQKTVGKLMIDGLGLLLQTSVGLALLAFYHPLLLGFDILMIAALIVVLALGYGAVPTAIAESNAKYKVAAWLETIAAHPLVFSREQASTFAAVRADALTRDYLSARRRHYARVLRQLIGGVGAQVIATVLLLGIGGWLVMERELTLGQLVAAELVVGLVGAGFAKFAKHLESGYDLLAGLDKIGKILDLRCEDGRVNVRVDDGSGAPGLEVRGLSIGATTAPVDAEVEPGARTLLESPSSSAASAFLAVLAGLERPESGVIRFDGLEAVPGWSNPLRSSAFLLRPRDLIEGSILDNLRVGDLTLSEEQAWVLLDRVRLDEVVASLPDGLDTTLVPSGSPLTPCQITRLCVARALAASPALLLVDGALDDLGLPRDEADEVLREFLGPDAPWTVIMASHDERARAWASSRIALAQEMSS